MSNMEMTKAEFDLVRRLTRYAVTAVVVLMAIIAGLASTHSVPAGHRGVVKLFGDVQPEPLSEGLHFLNPLARVVDFNVRFQALTAKNAEGGTVDLQRVFEDLTLNYSYDPRFAPYVYNNFGDDASIDNAFIFPAMVEAFKSVTSHYTAEELVTRRGAVSHEVKLLLQEKLAKYHIIVSDINVTNFHFDDTFARAIEQKVVAAQQRLTAEQQLETAKITAQQQVVQATAKAQATVVAADAAAKAITVQAQAIQAQGGAQYVQLQAIEKWKGEVPQYMGGGQPVPFVNIGGK